MLFGGVMNRLENNRKILNIISEYIEILWLFLGALFYHVVLMAGIIGATKAGLSEWAQGLIMVADAVCLFWFWWLVGKKGIKI